jgi:hypothetical protein
VSRARSGKTGVEKSVSDRFSREKTERTPTKTPAVAAEDRTVEKTAKDEVKVRR